jgi:hypothetical protein
MMTNALHYVKPLPVSHSYDTVLTFGRYKGEKVRHVLQIEPGWLLWAANNVDGFILDRDVLNDADDAENMNAAAWDYYYRSMDDTYEYLDRD